MSNSELTVFIRSSDVPPGRGRGRSRGFVAADPDRAQNLGRPQPRTPIMWRLHADLGDNPDPGIQHYIEKIVDEQRAIRQRTHLVGGRA
jgi:hypothetical protein